MTLSGWIAEFCAMHERYKQGALASDDSTPYRDGRDDLQAVLLAAQRLALGGKAQTRIAIRVNQAFPVELTMPSGTVKAVTHDVAIGGMSTLVPTALTKGDRLPFRLRLSRHVDVSGMAVIVHVEEHQGAAKIACKFEELSDEDRLRLDDAVFESVVAQLRLLPKRS